MQQRARLLHIQHQLRLTGNRRAEVRRRFLFRRHAAFDRQTGIGPAFPAAVEQTHVFHPGVQQNLRHAGGGVDVATVENHRGVMTNTLFRQQRFQLGIGDLIPQRFAFHLVGIDIAGAGNMIQQIEFGRAPGGFNHFPLSGRCGGHRFTLLEVVQPLRVNQLLKVRQLLQAFGLTQRIAKGAEMGKPCGLQARGDFRVVCIAAVQRDGGIGPQLMLSGPRAKLFIVHGAEPTGGEIQRLRFVTLRAVSLLGPAVVERAQACINRDTVLLLAWRASALAWFQRRRRWKQQARSAGRVRSIEKHVSSKCPTREN
jgi:hypothetical protein